MNIQDSELFDFHDFSVIAINIESKTDFMDEITISLQYDDEMYRIGCFECAYCNFVGNGWIAGKDTIRTVQYKKGDELAEIEIPDFIPKDKMHYIDINLNTSNSHIRILAEKILFNEIK